MEVGLVQRRWASVLHESRASAVSRADQARFSASCQLWTSMGVNSRWLLGENDKGPPKRAHTQVKLISVRLSVPRDPAAGILASQCIDKKARQPR